MSPATARSSTPANEIVRGDPRYAQLVKKRFNKRFAGTPDCFRIVSSPEDVAVALEQAASKNQRVTVQSGGHCLEGFVSDPEIRVVIDTSLLSSVHYDRQMGAFSIGAGATLGEAYRKLFSAGVWCCRQDRARTSASGGTCSAGASAFYIGSTGWR